MDSKVTTVLPSYIGSKFLNNSIESIISQTYPYIEILLVLKAFFCELNSFFINEKGQKFPFEVEGLYNIS